MPVKRAKKFKAKCDDLWGKIVRSNGYCERCGRSKAEVQIQAAHIISRRFSNTRVLIDNGVALCAADHRYFHDHPVRFGEWIIDRIGIDKYNALERTAELTTKVDWELEFEKLKELWKSISEAS